MSVSAADRGRIAAAAYVWGRQDAGDSPRDTGYSIDFANWYADMAADYEAGRIGMLPSIQEAYGRWVARQGPHIAVGTPQPDGLWRVTCPHGCLLGTSALTTDQLAASRRVDLHRLATDRG